MKSRFNIYILLFYIIIFSSNLKADTIFFNSENLKIENDGQIIYSSKGIAKIPDQKILIEGDRSIYNKLISELVVIGNVKFFDNSNNVYIESEKAIYNQKENTVLASGKTFMRVENKYEVNSNNVLYNRNTMIIESEKHTSVYDDKNNIYNFEEGFLFDTFKEVISSKRTNIVDSDNNNYLFERVKINLLTKELVGKEVKVEFLDSFFGNENNDPLLKGKSSTSDEKKLIIQKAVFSTCNVENKDCRGWELQSQEFTHNKVEKLFEYKNSWLKVFDKKVFFIPYFNHPDPTVKRKTGFLTPVYSSSKTLGRAINIPYFFNLSPSKDITFNPRIYAENDFILQSEYRQAFKKSDLIADISFNNDQGNSSTAAFLDLRGNFEEKTSYALELQNVTDDDYLKIHDFRGIIDTNSLVDRMNGSSLTNYFSIKKVIDENTELSTSIRMYEDLTTSVDSDKYQYIFPDFSFNKNIELDESYNGVFTFSSSGYQKNYDTNIYEAQVNNDFNFSTYDYFTGNGLLTNYSLVLKNFNTYSENSEIFEDNNDHELFNIFTINSELPLKKRLANSTNYLKPKIQFKLSPTNGKDISSDEFRLSYDNLFSINRIGRSDMVEEGKSLTLGLEFEKQNFENEKIMGFNLGNIIKDKKNLSMPTKSKLDQTRSDIVGNVYYSLNDELSLDYNFSYDRDLDYSNYDAIKAKYSSNKLITSFDYSTANHEYGNSEDIANETTINFTDEHTLQFNTSKDLINDFTQYYRLSYKYETDCLLATLEYNKKFFRDGDLIPDESLYFLIKFIPFTEVRGSANTIFEY